MLRARERSALLRYQRLKARAANAFLLFFFFAFFFPRFRPVPGPPLRGESLPRPGQAAQKQMRSDTGAKENSPEPHQAHGAKCPSPRGLRSVGALHAQVTDMETGRLRAKSGA